MKLKSHMKRDLNKFVNYFHLTKFLCPQMLKRIEKIYSKFWPLTLSDKDIRIFLSVLYLATRYFKPRVVVQTGTFIGTSSIAVALALEESLAGLLYTIDPDPPRYFGVSEPVSIARAAAKQGGLDGKICFIKGYSTVPSDRGRMKLVPASTWQLKKIAYKTSYDMLVVDGDHTFLGCYFDLIYGTPGLALDGPRVIVVHDYLGIPEVNNALKKWRSLFRNHIMKVVPSPCGIALLQLK